jgi:hypothetical protein
MVPPLHFGALKRRLAALEIANWRGGHFSSLRSDSAGRTQSLCPWKSFVKLPHYLVALIKRWQVSDLLRQSLPVLAGAPNDLWVGDRRAFGLNPAGPRLFPQSPKNFDPIFSAYGKAFNQEGYVVDVLTAIPISANLL